MKVFISRNYKEPASAGSKAKSDIETILLAHGWRNIGLRRTTFHNKALDFLLTFLGKMKALALLKPGDTLFLQYPVKKYYRMLCRLARRRGVRVITVIHDLGSFRRKKVTEEREIEKLNLSDVVIAHSPAMTRWLARRGCRAELRTLCAFDYLGGHTGGGSPDNTVSFGADLLFVGNLSPKRNMFLYLLADTLSSSVVYAYGNNFDTSRGGDHLRCMGFAPDTYLMDHHRGHYGLSWYGQSLTFDDASEEEYLRYNNPHKVSLYLRCGRPVITWEKAAMAPFIEREGVGILVPSLERLQERLDTVTADEYAAMAANARRVAADLASGYFISTALAGDL